jgi:hypothetical protein
LTDKSLLEDNELKEEEFEDRQIKLSSYRFFNIAIFILADLAPTMMFSTFTPISKQITYIYDINNNFVTATSNIILLLNMPLPFLGSYSNLFLL